MDITVYLPDELGQWAKDAGLPFSQMLRAGVQAERYRQEAAAKLTGDAKTYELGVEDPRTGRSYTARFHGTPLHELRGDVEAFLGEDEEVWVYDARQQRLWVIDQGQEDIGDVLGNLLTEDEYIEAMDALGRTAVIDVGQQR